jgi:predicted nucleotidyltransferase
VSLLQAHDPVVSPHPTHRLPPLAELEHALARALAAWPSARAAWLFGSVAEGSAGPLSDVDVAILGCADLTFDERARLAVDLERAAGRRCDVVRVEQASPVLGAEIIRAGRRFLCHDPAAADEWEEMALRRYLDTAQLRRLVHGYVRADLLGTDR